MFYSNDISRPGFIVNSTKYLKNQPNDNRICNIWINLHVFRKSFFFVWQRQLEPGITNNRHFLSTQNEMRNFCRWQENIIPANFGSNKPSISKTSVMTIAFLTPDPLTHLYRQSDSVPFFLELLVNHSFKYLHNGLIYHILVKND